jgi:hypothetical protein
VYRGESSNSQLTVTASGVHDSAMAGTKQAAQGNLGRCFLCGNRIC